MGKHRPGKRGERRRASAEPPAQEALSTEAHLKAAEARELAMFAAHDAVGSAVSSSSSSKLPEERTGEPVDLSGTWNAERSATRQAAEERSLLRVLHRGDVTIALNVSGGEICWQMDTRDLTKTVFGLPGCGTLLMDRVALISMPGR